VSYDLNESTSTLLKKANQLFIRIATIHLKELNIPHAYTLFLMQLWDQDGQTQTTLHRKIGIEQPTAVRTLDRMERDNFVKRVRCEEDRRVIKIFLTNYAKKLKNDALACAENLNDLMLSQFSKADRKKLNFYLKLIIQTIESNLPEKG